MGCESHSVRLLVGWFIGREDAVDWGVGEADGSNRFESVLPTILSQKSSCGPGWNAERVSEREKRGEREEEEEAASSNVTFSAPCWYSD